MSGLANSAEVHLRIGPRHLWNVWQKPTHQTSQGLRGLKHYYSQNQIHLERKKQLNCKQNFDLEQKTAQPSREPLVRKKRR
jgi:hypothetical protein